MKKLTERLADLERDGLVFARRHPTEPLTIYNYTPEVHYKRLWDLDSLLPKARGLIVGDDGRVVSRPFEKFFNLYELEADDIPVEPFVAFEKLDGSLLISYPENGHIALASRGSFTSDHAAEGTRMLTEWPAYEALLKAMARYAPEWTFCFELIHPDLRVALDYGGRKELVLLDAIHIESGESMGYDLIVQRFWPNVNVPRVFHEVDGLESRYEIIGKMTSIQAEADMQKPPIEGYVCVFKSGARIKLKTDSYVDLHRRLFGMSERRIYESMLSGEDPLYGIPRDHEVYDWAENIRRRLSMDQRLILAQSRADFASVDPFLSRREMAEIWNASARYPQLCFMMLDEVDGARIEEAALKRAWDHLKAADGKASTLTENQ